MTTKPKAKKFRVRRPGERPTPIPDDAPRAQPAARPAAARSARPDTTTSGPPAASDPARAAKAPGNTPTAPSEDASTPASAPTTPAPAEIPSKAPADAAAETRDDTPADPLAAIREEGLTGRQLRMARRVAQKHGLTTENDFEAVLALRQRGIDPFQRSNMLELVVPGSRDTVPATTDDKPAQVPQTVEPARETLPSTERATPMARRAAEISRIQRDLVRRRRRKLALLFTRLAFFVLLPTAVAGYYYFAVATPMYATNSEFLILKAESGSGGAMGSLFSGTQFATNQDAIAVQSYLTSKDAMLRLDRDVGFKEHFTQPWIDPIQRLGEDPSNEEAFDLYKRNIEIGYDPTEGVIKMEVVAAEPEVAAEFSRALLGYAEERVDNLSARKRANAVQDAEAGLAESQLAREEAQERLVRLQQDGAMVDPEGRIAALRSQINNIEIQLQEKNLQLQALLDNARPNSSRVEGARGDVRRLEALLDDLNGQMTQATTGENSLAETAVQIQLAQADLSTRDMMLQTALERLEQARRDADSQARYLTTSVQPVASEDATYPRKFENTILAFLIFSGIYLLVSLTASILREQVSN